MKGWYKGTRKGLTYYRSSTLGTVEQIRKRNHMKGAAWVATRIDGSPVRVDTNADGTPYVERSWHEERDRPIRRYFPSAKAAMRALAPKGAI